jgi:SAM-dependent methyltransferase
MSSDTTPPNEAAFWNERYERPGFFFGIAPNRFLESQQDRLRAGWRALAVADGEGRNGVWLARQGLEVVSVDFSPVALEKARALAAEAGVEIATVEADLTAWSWPEAQFDLVVAIFIQFAPPGLREQIFSGMQRALRPGGLLIVQGYRPEQVNHGTGGPPWPEHMYTDRLLRDAFADLEILHLEAHDSVIQEGSGHDGLSALIDLVARRPGAADGKWRGDT